MSSLRVVSLTFLTMVAFAGNSVLCRVALKQTGIDAASFTSIRLVSGALFLWAMALMTRNAHAGRGNWPSAFALFTYAAGFSFAYLSLTAATGALLLFGAVQATMISHGLWKGERLCKRQLAGFIMAAAGLIGLLLPGVTAPPFWGSVLMLSAGIAWGVYSLRGKSAGNPTRVTAGNFLRAVLFAALLTAVQIAGRGITLDRAGLWYAVVSGAIASGMGYAIWYSVLPALKSTNAATVQLCVPVLAALGGVIFLGEVITARVLLASVAVLGGIAMVILKRQAPDKPL